MTHAQLFDETRRQVRQQGPEAPLLLCGMLLYALRKVIAAVPGTPAMGWEHEEVGADPKHILGLWGLVAGVFAQEANQVAESRDDPVYGHATLVAQAMRQAIKEGLTVELPVLVIGSAADEMVQAGLLKVSDAPGACGEPLLVLTEAGMEVALAAEARSGRSQPARVCVATLADILLQDPDLELPPEEIPWNNEKGTCEHCRSLDHSHSGEPGVPHDGTANDLSYLCSCGRRWWQYNDHFHLWKHVTDPEEWRVIRRWQIFEGAGIKFPEQ